MREFKVLVRALHRRKWATLTVVATLAVGIALNTSAFGIVNALVFRPMVIKDGERLVVLTEQNTKFGGIGLTSLETFRDWRRQARSFEGMEAMQPRSANIAEAGLAGAAPEGVSAGAVTPGAVSFMGFRPVIGRTFQTGEDQNGVRVAMIGENLWKRRFAADPGILGKEILVDGVPTTVIGILPWRFQFMYGGYQLLTPLTESVAGRGRDARQLQVLARRKPGVSIDEAQAEMTVISAGVAERSPESQKNWDARVFDFRSFIYSTAMKMYPVLLAAAMLVLLIVCANVSNLVLAQGAARRKEMAIRAALGANRWRIIRQMMGEGMIQALAGGLLAFLAVVWVRDIMVANYQELSDLKVDYRVFCYTLLVSLLAGAAFSLAPALTASRFDVTSVLKGVSGGSAKGGTHGLRRVLVVVELALSLMLLTGTGLLVRTAYNIKDAEAGFPTERLLTAQLNVRGEKYATPEQRLAFARQVQSKLQVMPGVESVAMMNQLPLWGEAPSARMEIAGADEPARTTGQRVALAGYTESLGVPIKAGRALAASDSEKSEPVALVNEAMAQMLWSGNTASAVGRRIRLNGGPWLRVVGVSGNVKQDLMRPAHPEVITPMAQSPVESFSLVLRIRGEVKAMSDALRIQIAGIDPMVPVNEIRTMDEMIEDYYPRVMIAGIAVFAVVSILLASIGLYGVMASFMEQRRREIGIRIALGADRRTVLRLVTGQSLRLSLWGVGAGLLGAFGLAKVLAGFLYGVSASDPLVFSSVSLIMLSVAIIAGYMPARRAAKVDPIEVLREE